DRRVSGGQGDADRRGRALQGGAQLPDGHACRDAGPVPLARRGVRAYRRSQRGAVLLREGGQARSALPRRRPQDRRASRGSDRAEAQRGRKGFHRVSALAERAAAYFHELQDRITAALEAADGAARFREDAWARPGGGGGRTRVIADGAVFEKGGVNVSDVHGELGPEM